MGKRKQLITLRESAGIVAKDNQDVAAMISSLQTIGNNAVISLIDNLPPEKFSGYNDWGAFFDGEIGIDYDEWIVMTNASELPDYDTYKPQPSQSSRPAPMPTGIKYTFVITGVLGVTRADAEDTIRRLGHYVESRVRSNVDYLIVGQKPGKTKLNAAKNHAVQTINEREALQLLGILSWN